MWGLNFCIQFAKLREREMSVTWGYIIVSLEATVHLDTPTHCRISPPHSSSPAIVVMLHPRPERRGAPAAMSAMGCGFILSVLVCVSTVNAQPASNSYFSAETPPSGAVFYYTPGDTFVFPPSGTVVEVHDPDSNATMDGNLQPLNHGAGTFFFMESDPTITNYDRGPIASISRGAYIGTADFLPGRPNSFRPLPNEADDPHQATKEQWFCPEWGAFLGPREPEPGIAPAPLFPGCDAATIPFDGADVSFTNLVDDSGRTWTNRTSFKYTFTVDAAAAAAWEAPNAQRTVCIQAATMRGLNPDANADSMRCWTIIFNTAPTAAQCPEDVDELTCGKKQLPLVLRSQINMAASIPVPSTLQIVRVAVGQTLKAHVYFEDLNRDDTVNCSTCDDVIIDVLSNPGLPNGATLDETKGRNDLDFGPDAPSRLVRYKNDASDSTRAYYVYSRLLTFTPTLADARNVKAGEDAGNGVMYSVCFTATSVKRGTTDPNAIITSMEYCGFIQVVLPRPAMVDAVQQRPPTPGMTMELPFYDMMNEERFITPTRCNPQPVDADPVDTTGCHLPYEVTVRCPYEWVIRTEDGQNNPDGVVVASDMVAGYEAGFYQSSVMAHPDTPLPMRMEIIDHAMDGFVNHQILSWTPERGMEGHTFSFCLHVTDKAIRTNAFAACTRMVVRKCEVCTEVGDTLHSVALDYRTDWLQLWGANPLVPAPNLLGQYHKLNLGPLFTTNRDEATSVLAARFSMTPEDLAAVNPDFGELKSVVSGTDVCIVPRICDGGPQESMM